MDRGVKMAIRVVPNPNPILTLIYGVIDNIYAYVQSIASSLSNIYSYIIVISGDISTMIATWLFTFDTKIPWSLVTIDEAHRALHEGQFFVYETGIITLANDGGETPVLSLSNFNGNPAVHAHATITAKAHSNRNYISAIIPNYPVYEGYCILRVYEQATDTAATSPLNRNRVIGYTGAWLANSSGIGRIDGNLIYSEIFSKYEGVTIPLRENGEFILDAGKSAYLITVEPLDGRDSGMVTRAQVIVNWYEIWNT